MSDIFNNYAKIMADKGLVKKSQRSEEAKARPQGVDHEAIEMLYHVKPNGKDEPSIVEQAHPEPAYIAPAYDRLNGLVENVEERQSVLIDIALKPNDGKLTQRRYVKANEELLQELIRVATFMDSRGEEELMKLADACASSLVEPEMKKEAAIPFLLAAKVIGWAAGGLAAYTAFSNNVNMSAGLVKDADALIEEAKDILSPEWYIDEDDDIPPEATQQVSQLVTLASKIKVEAKKAHRMRYALAKSLAKASKAVEGSETDPTTEKLINNEYHDGLMKFFKAYEKDISSYLENVSVLKSSLERSVSLYQGTGGFMGMLTELKRQVLPSHLQDVVMLAERLTKSLTAELSAVGNDIATLEGLKEANDKVKEETLKMEEEGDLEELPDVELSALLEQK